MVLDDDSMEIQDMARVAPDNNGYDPIVDEQLVDFLNDINGTDTYNSTSLAKGKLDSSHYLKIPLGFQRRVFSETGISVTPEESVYENDELAQIYVLNKEIFGNDERAIKIALLRMMAVKAGWRVGHYEVVEVASAVNANDVMALDLPVIKRFIDQASKLATLLPMVAEVVFRTMGHHYLTGLDGDYSAKYQRIFNACVEPDLTSYLPNADLYHTALHWVDLKDSFQVASNPSNISWLPRAIVIRTGSAPAGTALVCTSSAVLNAMDGAGLKDSLVVACGLPVGELETVVASIRAAPLTYHTIPHAYRVTSSTSSEEFEKAKATAMKLAPVLQGFLDALPNSASLAQARALSKHADANPLMRRRAKVFFREAGTTKATDMGELFAMNRRHNEAQAEDNLANDDDSV